MQLIDNIVIIGLIVASFFLGRHITLRDYEKLLDYYNYFYRMDAAKQGVGYVAAPSKRRAPIGQNFMDRLKETGRATQVLSKN